MTVTEAGIVMSNEDRNWLEQRLDTFEGKVESRLTRMEDKLEGKIDKLPCLEHKESLAKLTQHISNGVQFDRIRRQDKSLSIKWVIAIVAVCNLAGLVVQILLNR